MGEMLSVVRLQIAATTFIIQELRLRYEGINGSYIRNLLLK